MRAWILSWAAVGMLAFGLFRHDASAGVFTLPGHYASIQAAIEHAPDGSLVRVSAGSYGLTEAVHVRKRLYFLAVDGPSATTVSGAGRNRLLLVRGAAADPAHMLVFDGFTFRDGFAGGAHSPVTLENARVTFINCVFRDNHSEEKGGAVSLYGANARAYFLECTFFRNTSDRSAGAVLAADGMPRTFFKNCHFEQNSNRTPAGRNVNQGGALLFNDAPARIVNSRFVGNSAAYAGGAVMLIQWWDRPEIRFDIWGCRFDDNFVLPIPGHPVIGAPTEGGAVKAENNLVAHLRGNTFVGNVAMSGGGVSLYRAHMDIHDSVFDGNQATGTRRLGGGGALAVSANDAGDADRREPRVRLEQVLMRENTAPVGGGIFAVGDLAYNKQARLTLVDVSLAGNLATTAGDSHGHGGGLFLHRMRLEASDTYLLRNTAEGLGGAAAFVDRTSLNLVDSIVAGNEAVAGDPAFHASADSETSLIGTLLAYNGGAPTPRFTRFGAVPNVSMGDDAWLTWATARASPAPTLTPPGIDLEGRPLSAGAIDAGPVSEDQTYTLTTTDGVFEAEVAHTRTGIRDTAWNVVPILPARVEAEDFDRLGEGASYRDQTPTNQGGAYRPDDAVDIAAAVSASNGHYVGWTDIGEWLEYTVRAPSRLNGRIDVAVSAQRAGGSFYLQVNGQTVGSLVEVPDTGGGENWQVVSIPDVVLEEGLHEVRFVVVQGGFNLDYWAFAAGAAPILTVSPVSIRHTIREGSAIAPQELTLLNTGAVSLDFGVTTSVPWMEVAPVRGRIRRTPETLTVSFDSAGLAAGTHRGEITIWPSRAGGSPVTVRVTLVVRRRGVRLDFDGDGVADMGFYFPPGGAWYVRQSERGPQEWQFGFAGTIPVVGDFDGDGQADLGCYHPPTGMWYIYRSTEGFFQVQFGFAGTIPIVGDFDGDGVDDFGCYHPPTGMWYIYRSTEGFYQVQFGFAGTIPIVGDFDGDGVDDFGCYHPPTGMWYVYRSTEGFYQVQFGFAGTLPVVGDFDGDGIDDFGCYHPPSGGWFVYRSREGFWQAQFGYAGTVPVVGDFDGDGRSDLGVYYPPGGNWYIYGTRRGFYTEEFGYAGTIPLGSPFLPY